MVFKAKPESHEQDGEKLSRAPVRSGMRTASGDPAMAFLSLAYRKRRTFVGSCLSPAAPSPPDQCGECLIAFAFGTRGARTDARLTRK
jgi:hypothetical protein